MLLNTHHEKEVAVHLNGVIIHQESGRLDHNSETYPNDGFRAALKPEGNRP